ncbi:MAG: hypothetical protein IKD77_05690 [Bacilli bacterium]|nr:hypothetical protein [Bacilli bacterium]
MENELKVRLGDLGYFIVGIRLGIKDKEIASTDTKKIKLFNLANLKLFVEEQIIDNVPEYPIRLEYKSKKAEIYIQKNDIVFSAFPSKSSDDNIIYIYDDINDAMYSETVFIFRLLDEYKENKDIMCEYIYLMLKSGLYSDYISNLNVGYSHRLRPQMLQNMQIPILDKEKMKELCRKYDTLRNKKMKLKKQEKELMTDLYNINNVYKK